VGELEQVQLKIVHVITGLDTGGAETSLARLLARMDRTRFDLVVVSLRDGGVLRPQVEALGIPVYSLGVKRGAIDPRGFTRLRAILRREKPDIVQSWMYHADLLSGVAGKFAGRPPVVWNIRNGAIKDVGMRKMTRLVAHACGWTSRTLPTKIVCCSVSARAIHVGLRYDDARIVLIPNGYDIDAFSPNDQQRHELRAELGVSAETPLIGIAARFDSIKDHRTFVNAAAIVAKRHPDARFLMCGDNINSENATLMDWIRSAGIEDRMILLGRRSDMSRIYSGIDLLASSSITEGFPNTIAEAMACGKPCAVTNVGDAALIVGELGRVVPPSDPAALARAISELIELGDEERRGLGEAARDRIASQFSMAKTTAQYEALYEQIAGTRPR
jgi:glycosyltransferase involved in cell wall biosynthesis